MLSQVIEEALKKSIPTKTPEFRMSMAGDCLLKIVRDHLHGISAPSPNMYLRMESGHALHDKLLGMIAEPIGLSDREKELEIVYDGIKIIGHCDGTIQKDNAVLEFKTVSDNTFTMIVNQGKPLDQHIDQANLYAFALKLPWIVILYFNRDTAKFLSYRFEADDDRTNRILARLSYARKLIDAKTLPARPYMDPNGSPCWYCDHKLKCYEGFKQEVEGAPAGQDVDSGSYSLGAAFLKARDQRLSMEKEEKKARESLINGVAGKYSELNVSGKRLVLSVGTTGSVNISIKGIK